jgi:cytochrome P450
LTTVSPIGPEFDLQTFDIWDDEQAQHIYAIFAEMNRRAPVTFTRSHGGHWVVTGYEEVRDVGQDWATFSSEHGVQVPSVGLEHTPPITVDPPLQRLYRKPMAPFFSPSAAKDSEAGVQRHADTLIDRFADRGHCDLAADYAERLVPLVFFDEVLHVPADALERFVTKFVHPGSTPRDHTAVAPEVARDLVDLRRAMPPQGDLVDAVLTAEIDGRPLTEDEIHGVIVLLLLGGTDTTRNVITSSLHYMALNPGVRTMLVEDPGRIERAVEEFLRMFASVQTIGRTAMRDTDVAGERNPLAGGKLVCALAAANRDPAEFDHPDEFDVDRVSNRHFAFGVGPHRCIGSNLARMEIKVAIERILARIPDYELAPGWTYRRRGGFVHGPESLEIVFP